MLMCSHHGGIGLYVPIDLAGRLRQRDHLAFEASPGAVLGPTPEPFMRCLPRPVPLRHVPPRRPGSLHPADPVDHLPVIPPPATTAALLRQQRLQNRPLTISQIETRHTDLTIHHHDPQDTP